MIIPVILCGGVGSRLWPVSREATPKQFLSIDNERSLLQNTVLRVDGTPYGAPIVVCNQDYRFRIAEQLQDIDVQAQAILLEPEGRNTAPAIAVAAYAAMEAGHGDAVILVLPSDHVILENDAFAEVVEAGAALASQGKLVTFGITPNHAATGYGYIARGKALGDEGYTVRQFIEKPDKEKAAKLFESGEYFWNSGMFMFTPNAYLAELKAFEPDIAKYAHLAMQKAARDLDFVRLDAEAFHQAPDQSIDYGVMEHTASAAVVPATITWTDVGNWQSMWEIASKDANGNSVQGDILTLDSKQCYFRAKDKLIAAIGVENLIVVDTDDALLVADKGRSEQVKKLVKELKRQKRPEYLEHKRVYRPWGHYDSVSQADGFQIKRIVVKPGGKLSLQMHHHRSEHWVVVSGTATVTCDDKEFALKEGESTFIPLGSRHRLENRTEMPLEIVEVQVGSYLGEDDIVRYEDVYGRDDDSADGGQNAEGRPVLRAVESS